ncbi:MAG: UDP-N-acetylmuramoyl-L-alanyl-D-glutamate--2,6-diaminopimelate ligase, partial [Muribaculaceae bacterium]|nr:UDP-N-acetylmuramoyl-L-alanyl-D-glutamate--2,6-diaminopimelate ligase [Muribaculaceae bacterium]
MKQISLKELLQSYHRVVDVHGDIHTLVSGVEFDSRRIQPGNLFIAINGTAVDGHSFIPQVISAGAIAIVCEILPESLVEGVCYVVVESSASACGYIASQYYGNPSSKLILTGVTGTNGKTTTATLLYEMARLCGYKAGLLSTVCNYIDDKPIPATQTTPDPLSINRMLAEMVDAGCKYAFMEVSSHAAVQCRIDGLTFKCGIFTNLTRDHLDYHKTTQNYIAAKKRFFDLLPADAVALTNIDDANGNIMVQNTKARVYTYSMRSLADFRGKIIESRLDGTLLEINGKEVDVIFVGAFNAYNLLAVYGAASLIGLPHDKLLVNLSLLVPVAGRFQIFQTPSKVSVVV